MRIYFWTITSRQFNVPIIFFCAALSRNFFLEIIQKERDCRCRHLDGSFVVIAAVSGLEFRGVGSFYKKDFLKFFIIARQIPRTIFISLFFHRKASISLDYLFDIPRDKAPMTIVLKFSFNAFFFLCALIKFIRAFRFVFLLLYARPTLRQFLVIGFYAAYKRNKNTAIK